MREWRAINKEAVNAAKLRWAQAHPENVLERKKRHFEANKPAILAKAAARKRARPELRDADNLSRRLAHARAIPAWANQFYIEEAYRLARLRSKVTGIKWHVDHIVPLRSKRVCGLHVEANLQVIPAVLNVRKNNRHWPNMPTEAAL